MKEYFYRKTRAKVGIVLLFIFLISVLVFFKLLGDDDMFLILLVVFSAIYIFVVIRQLKRMMLYKAIIDDHKLMITTPDTPKDLGFSIQWHEVKSITYCGKRIWDKSICVNGKFEKIVFNLSAFKDYKDLLKAIIRHSCDNEGFYSEQRVLKILRNE